MFLKRFFNFIIIILILLFIFNLFNYRLYFINSEARLADYYNNNDVYEGYVATLIIDDINLEGGLYEKNNKLNNINYGLEVIDKSDFPDKENLLIIAGHSGNSKVSLFHNLDKLSIGTIIKLNYLKSIYLYRLDYIYSIEKGSKLKLPRFNNKTICLITCDKYDETRQNVYVGTMII